MDIDDLDLALALRRLADASEPPPVDPRREAELMAATTCSVSIFRITSAAGSALAAWSPA